MGKNSRDSLAIKVVAIAGPTGSGKTKLADKLLHIIGKDRCVVISQDSYYKNWSRLSIRKRKKINFDDIKSLDFVLLGKHIRDLKQGKAIASPCYSFVKSCRLNKGKSIRPRPVTIVEGLTPFIKPELRKLFDLKIYLDTDNSICLARRIKRDTRQRGDSIETVCRRYFKDVLPMQKKYVEPQKKYADIILNGKLPLKELTKKTYRHIAI